MTSRLINTEQSRTILSSHLIWSISNICHLWFFHPPWNTLFGFRLKSSTSWTIPSQSFCCFLFISSTSTSWVVPGRRQQMFSLSTYTHLVISSTFIALKTIDILIIPKSLSPELRDYAYNFLFHISIRMSNWHLKLNTFKTKLIALPRLFFS